MHLFLHINIYLYRFISIFRLLGVYRIAESVFGCLFIKIIIRAAFSFSEAHERPFFSHASIVCLCSSAELQSPVEELPLCVCQGAKKCRLEAFAGDSNFHEALQQS